MKKLSMDEYVRLLKNFYGEFYSYVIINAFLVLVWLLSGMGYFWPIWLIIFWGLFLLAKASKLHIIDVGFYEQCDALRSKFQFLQKDFEEDRIKDMLQRAQAKGLVDNGHSTKKTATPTTAEKSFRSVADEPKKVASKPKPKAPAKKTGTKKATKK